MAATEVDDWIASHTGSGVVRHERVQTLWSGYGEIFRAHLENKSSVIVKSVSPPHGGRHPRGWDTDRSHQRKLRSYAVEMAWYDRLAARCDHACRVPKRIATEAMDAGWRFILEDLNAIGFAGRRMDPDQKEMKSCLRWLARFHALFLGVAPRDLWETGTYWHLDTRPDELEAMGDDRLRNAAAAIDQRLSSARYQTLVHGDAKVANFCFGQNSVAAVDFQYVGGGCGIKDVAYFLSSCLESRELERQADDLLDIYFDTLKVELHSCHKDIDATAVEAEWRALYPVAWADFYRFLAGWSPGHWKMDTYSERLTLQVLGLLEGGS